MTCSPSRRLTAIVLSMSALVASAPADQAGPSDLKAFWREGQTFLTWTEDASVTGEWYEVYASGAPISADNIAKATCIAKIPEGSNKWGFWRNIKSTRGFWKNLAKEEWTTAIQIVDDEANSKRLADGTGLFVRTIKKPARTYYAVAIEGKLASLITPVPEKVETPGAVIQKKLADRYYLYAIFCDYEIFNPDGIEDNWTGYIHPIHVRAPNPKRKGVGEEPYPVAFRLHAYGAWKDWNIAYCWPGTHVNVKMLDYQLTWWYGYSDSLPNKDRRAKTPAPGKIVNFTERRVLQAATWLMKGPKNFPFKVDNDRFSLLGGSMGGTGAHFIGARNGDIFASALADEGIFNWAMDFKYSNWPKGIQAKFGPRARNDMTNEGIAVYELLNLPKQVVAHPEKELPLMAIGQGSMDTVIPFEEIVDYWKALEKGKHPFVGAWQVWGHLPWAFGPGPMAYLKIRRDEICPAFANAGCNTPLNSGFRIMGKAVAFEGKTLRIEPGSLKGPFAVDGGFPPGRLAGMTIMLGPTSKNMDVFTISSNTAHELTLAEGDLGAYVPPLSSWTLSQFKKKLKEAENREPTAGELKELALQRKASFLICDGRPRGSWNANLAWSTSLQNFDPKSDADDIVDADKKLAINLRLHDHKRWKHDGDSTTADVTPRRARKFKPAPGEQVTWENWDYSDPTKPRKVAGGEVPADKFGLVTVKQFKIGRKGLGNRLVLKRR